MKNVIFDFGGVLITFDPYHFLCSLTNDEEQARTLFSIILKSPQWVSLDRGTLSVADARRQLIQSHPDREKDIHHFFAHWEDMFHPVEPALEILYDLNRRNVPLYAISNFIRELHQSLAHRFPFFDLFQGIVFSYQIHAVKPEPKIYQHFINTYSLNPQDCVFIDDMQKNVNGAQDFGITGIQFHSPRQLRMELESLSIL
jgi:epoxide hydrolase-like predicted phosphatase